MASVQLISAVEVLNTLNTLKSEETKVNTLMSHTIPQLKSVCDELGLTVSGNKKLHYAEAILETIKPEDNNELTVDEQLVVNVTTTNGSGNIIDDTATDTKELTKTVTSLFELVAKIPNDSLRVARLSEQPLEVLSELAFTYATDLNLNFDIDRDNAILTLNTALKPQYDEYIQTLPNEDEPGGSIEDNEGIQEELEASNVDISELSEREARLFNLADSGLDSKRLEQNLRVAKSDDDGYLPDIVEFKLSLYDKNGAPATRILECGYASFQDSTGIAITAKIGRKVQLIYSVTLDKNTGTGYFDVVKHPDKKLGKTSIEKDLVVRYGDKIITTYGQVGELILYEFIPKNLITHIAHNPLQVKLSAYILLKCLQNSEQKAMRGNKSVSEAGAADMGMQLSSLSEKEFLVIKTKAYFELFKHQEWQDKFPMLCQEMKSDLIKMPMAYRNQFYRWSYDPDMNKIEHDNLKSAEVVPSLNSALN